MELRKISEMYDFKGQNLVHLLSKQHNSKGRQIIIMLNKIKSSYYVLEKNYEDVYKSIRYYKKNFSVWDTPQRNEELKNFMKEFNRFFHNYLASFSSLVDHTYKILNKLDKEGLNTIKEELDRLKKEEHIRFLKDLKNYVQHVEVSITTAYTSFEIVDENTGKSETKQGLELNKKELLKWDGWKTDSKKYINKHKENIELNILLEESYNLISKFYESLYPKVFSVYSEEIEEFNKINEEFNKINDEFNKIKEEINKEMLKIK